MPFWTASWEVLLRQVPVVWTHDRRASKMTFTTGSVGKERVPDDNI